MAFGVNWTVSWRVERRHTYSGIASAFEAVAEVWGLRSGSM